MSAKVDGPVQPSDSHNVFVAPASFAQQRLWFIDQLDPGNPVYNVSLTYRLSGQLNVDALRCSLNEVVRRHESLRTTFALEAGEPVQVIAPALEVALPVDDLRHLPAAEREAAALDLARTEGERPFDLACDPLLRAMLWRLDETDHVLLLAMHHIVCDEWSVNVLFQEMQAAYQAFANGQQPALPDLPIQYADFAVWQKEWLQGETFDRQLAYWRQELADLPPPIELPADCPRPAALSHRGAQLCLRLPQSLARAVQSVARQERVTPFMVLLAAYHILIHRYTGLDDVAVASFVANRNRVELEPLIGFFVNTIVLRANLSGNPTFRQLLGQMREKTLAAVSHQDLPFDRLVQALRPAREADRTPLCELAFNIHDVAQLGFKLPGLTAHRLDLHTPTAKFDLTLRVDVGPDEIATWMEYRTDLFKPSAIERMLGHYQTLLEHIVENPGRLVSELRLMPDAEWRQVVVDWNDTRTDYPRDQSVPALFEAQAERSPEAVAITWGERRLTYAELNRRANRLANDLRERGVRPGALVGLCLERSMDMVVAMLAVLKAGGAYLPLDPSYPAERLQVMLDDARVAALLAQGRHLPALTLSSMQAIDLEGEAEAIARQSAENPGLEIDPLALAYVMYTSGSTGRPKGVAVPQRAIVRLVRDTNYIRLGPGDHIAQASTASFDAATFEIWGALLNGATLVGVDPDVLLSPADLAAQLRAQHVHVLFLTTTLFNQVAALAPDAFRSLRDLLVGGEAVDPHAMRRVLAGGPPQRLLHVYGPTESTTFAAWRLVTEVEAGARTVPIGRPISNTRIYLLDRYLQPVPIGVPGELCIGGDGLALGYLNDPELTAAKFVPNPFDAGAGSRLYRTGDFARYLPDGDIEFIGRQDHQVKLRGYRIELGEIEAALMAHGSVQQAVVLLDEVAPGDKRLIAYVVPAGQPPSAESLRQYLEAKLPAYMTPASFVALDALPLTPAGKIDRQALARLKPAVSVDEGDDSMPRSDLEIRLAAIWAGVLGVERVGRHDDFFDLGGHSLLAIRLLNQIEKTLGQRVPVVALFRSSTVAALAAELGPGDRPPVRSAVAPLQPSGHKPPFFCVHVFGGDVFHYTKLASLLAPDQPCYGLRAKGREDPAAAHTTVEDMAAHCIEAMRSVQPDGPYCFGGYCSAGTIAFEMARQLYAQGQAVGLVALFDAYVPHRLRAQGRTWRLRDFVAILRNLPVWLRYNVPTDISHLMSRVHIRLRRKYRAWKKARGGGRADDVPPLLENFIGDLPNVGEGRRREMEAELAALWRYEPGTYPGRVTLFRSPALALTRPKAPELDWEKLALGGVDVKFVRAGHGNLMQLPQVRDLAAQLRASLLQARTGDDGSG